MKQQPAIWFPTVRCGTGTDVFTETLVAGLHEQGLQAEITWLPHHAEYLPWTVPIPKPPTWANIVHINTWLHPRFIPPDLSVVATLHHSIHDPALKPYKGWLRTAYHQHWIRRIERATMQRANIVVAVSQFAADSAKAHVLDCPMQVIHNGVDTKRFYPPANRQIHKPFCLLYVGSWMARKGVDLLAPIMRELGSDFVLHYTGGAAAEKDKVQMPPNMHDLGRLTGDEVVKAMHEADAFLFPSRSEGLPLTVLEAMACGLPVICTRGSSLTEVVQDGETGYLCPQDDVAAFVQAARQLNTSISDYAAYSEFARYYTQSKFTSNKMLDEYLLAYKNVFNTLVTPGASDK